jgi:hypothetical protein
MRIAIAGLGLVMLAGCGSKENVEPKSPEGQARLAAERRVLGQAELDRPTHEVKYATFYYLESPARGGGNRLASGSRVTLLEPNGAYSLVRDESGGVFWVEAAALKPITDVAPSTRPVSGG